MRLAIFTGIANLSTKQCVEEIGSVTMGSVEMRAKTLRDGGGISDTFWSMTDPAEMVDVSQPKPGKRGPCKKQAA